MNRILTVEIDYLDVDFAIWSILGQPALIIAGCCAEPFALVRHDLQVPITREHLPTPCAVVEWKFIRTVEGIEDSRGRKLEGRLARRSAG